MQPMPAFPQGEPAFIPLLKQHEPFVANWDDGAVCSTAELDTRKGLSLIMQLADDEHLLDTAQADFNRFAKEAGLAGDCIIVRVEQVDGLAYEGYRVIVGDDIRIEVSESEGARRALYYLQDELASSPFLKRGTVERMPWLRNRISRCFFGPIKRPPHNVDELMNDIDYYPEEYLSRLAHEGINGLWLTITFREICDSSLRPACPDAARRLAKLNATVERCRRYGIKIWAFCIEPCYWSVALGNPLPKGAEALLGPGWSREQAGQDLYSFCPKSAEAQQYLYECTYSLFKAVPHLGGLLNISFGERITSCLSRMNIREDAPMPCGGKCDLQVGDIFKLTNTAMERGMKAANSAAEMIAWLYIPEPSQIADWVYEMPKKLNHEVAIAMNFESGVTRTQLGRVRAGGDYWLSVVGPSDRFSRMAEVCRGRCDMAAKIQVGNSHEVATIPYVPVPGILYRKYRRMKELGVKHVMQCWYFGNYPGLMNEAAGKLAYEDFSQSEEAFLESLAKPAWGKDYRHAVMAWKLFAEAYSNYPLEIQFQYYGPMHDGPVWPLHLKRVARALTRTWQPDAFPAGDAIGECLTNTTLEDVTRLSGELSRQWHKGFEALSQASQQHHLLDFTLAEALDIQFASGWNILRFYSLRRALLTASLDDSKILLSAMREIVMLEMAASQRLAELCELDPRLGYHSEAEVFKYFPAKLLWRVDELKSLLANDFKQAEQLLEQGQTLAGFITEKDASPISAGTVCGEGGIHWSFDGDAETIHFHIDYDGVHDYAEAGLLILYEEDILHKPDYPVRFLKTAERKTSTGWHVDLDIPRDRLAYASRFRVGIERHEYLADGTTRITNDKPGDYPRATRLNMGDAMPDKTRLVSL